MPRRAPLPDERRCTARKRSGGRCGAARWATDPDGCCLGHSQHPDAVRQRKVCGREGTAAATLQVGIPPTDKAARRAAARGEVPPKPRQRPRSVGAAAAEPEPAALDVSLSDVPGVLSALETTIARVTGQVWPVPVGNVVVQACRAALTAHGRGAGEADADPVASALLRLAGTTPAPASHTPAPEGHAADA